MQPKEFIITEQQLVNILNILNETPYRFANPINDIIKVVIQAQEYVKTNEKD